MDYRIKHINSSFLLSLISLYQLFLHKENSKCHCFDDVNAIVNGKQSILKFTHTVNAFYFEK